MNFVYGMFYYSSMAKRGYALVKKLSLGRHGTKQARPDGSKNHVKELLLAISVSAVGAATLAACGSSSSAGSSATTAASSATTAASSSGMPDLSFFKGKTIDLQAPDKPGGDGDLSTREIAPALAQILHATVNVSNHPGAGGVVQANGLYTATPDGLTLGLIHLGPIIMSQALGLASGLKADMTKFSWIGNVTGQPFVIGTQPNDGIKTFAQLVKTTTPNTVIGSTTDEGPNAVIYSVFGIKHKFLFGYSSSSSEKQGFLANQGQNWNSYAGVVDPMVKAGQMRALAITSVPSIPAMQQVFKGVPTISQEVTSLGVNLTSSQKAALGGITLYSNYFATLAAPPGLSAGKLQTLRTAFSEAMKMASTQALAAKSNEPQYYVSGQNTAAAVQTMLTDAQALASFKSNG